MTLGLKDLYYAKVTEGETGDTWDTPEKLAPALTADLSVTTADGTLYADDAVSEIAKEFTKATLKLGIKDLTPEITADLLGQEVDANNVVWAGSEDDAPYVAVGFRAKKSGGYYKYVWLLKGKFKVPNETFKTKGESIEFNTPEIEGDFIKASNGKWKGDYVGKETDGTAKTWFDAVPSVKLKTV
jgi:phi13 family phage major tail protein